MKKIRWFLGIFNYGITWLGLLRIALSAACVWGAFLLFHSDEPFGLKIIGIVIIGASSLLVILLGFDNIKDGYGHLKHRDQERLLYRSYISHDDE